MRIFGPALVGDDLHGHVDPVAEQDVRLEGAAFVCVHAVDDERLAVPDAMLLVADSDDCVVHFSFRCQTSVWHLPVETF